MPIGGSVVERQTYVERCGAWFFEKRKLLDTRLGVCDLDNVIQGLKV
jgi:hypothetical protein